MYLISNINFVYHVPVCWLFNHNYNQISWHQLPLRSILGGRLQENGKTMCGSLSKETRFHFQRLCCLSTTTRLQRLLIALIKVPMDGHFTVMNLSAVKDVTKSVDFAYVLKMNIAIIMMLWGIQIGNVLTWHLTGEILFFCIWLLPFWQFLFLGLLWKRKILLTNS